MPGESFPYFLQNLRTEDFQYHLPEGAIARYPLEQRDASRLLIWENGEIRHSRFRNLAEELPADSLLILNDTRVLPARLHFQKDTGSWIELLILESKPGKEPASMRCKAIVGNRKKWKEEEVLVLRKDAGDEKLQLEASWANREKGQILLKWEPQNRIFPEILAMWGEMPIPPYLNRRADASDLENYQTVYARNPGAVAAPTAGLHFTDAVFADLAARKIAHEHITLHVGMGTFRPMVAPKVADHEMHPEEVIIRKDVIAKLAAHSGPLIGVGTTSVRSLESLYWLALFFKLNGVFPDVLESPMPYHLHDRALPATEVFGFLLEHMLAEKKASVHFSTRLYLMPGYQYRVIDGMVTNFHQPGSTLMVLVASLLGEAWKDIYKTALAEGYRFLSYGDSSLLLKPRI